MKIKVKIIVLLRISPKTNTEPEYICYEALSEVPEDADLDDLDSFTDLPESIREGVIAVYLEDELKDIDSCEGESDNKGKKIIV